MAWRGLEISRDEFADDLVAGDDAWIARWKVAFDDVKIGAADAAGENFKEDMVGLGLGGGDVFEDEGRFGDGSGGGENSGFHGDNSMLTFFGTKGLKVSLADNLLSFLSPLRGSR